MGQPRYPNAIWTPIQYNFNPGGKNAKMKYAMKGVKGLVLHITNGSYKGQMVSGTLGGIFSTFNNPSSGRSAHFCIDKDGTMHQYIAIGNVAWAIGGDPPYDWSWLSIENIGAIGDALTEKQIMGVANLMFWLKQQYQVPLKLANAPSQSGLGYHSMFNIPTRAACPGDPIIAQRKRILASAELGF